MKGLGLVFICSGIILMSLSGLEKILIFLSFHNTIQDLQTMIDLTPPYIWGITNYTFGFGLIFCIIGFCTFFSRKIAHFLSK